MAVGKNRHYKIMEILPRHWQQTKEIVGLSDSTYKEIVDELLEGGTNLSEKMEKLCPKEFPRKEVLGPILAGFKSRYDLLKKFQ